jgi:hypothetical protein
MYTKINGLKQVHEPKQTGMLASVLELYCLMLYSVCDYEKLAVLAILIDVLPYPTFRSTKGLLLLETVCQNSVYIYWL